MYYSYVEIEYVATSFSSARTDLALKLLKNMAQQIYEDEVKKRCCKSLTRAGAENLIIFGKNVK